MTRWDSADTRRKALQLLNSILTPQFSVYLVVLEIITALMHQVSSGLQKVRIDVVGAIQQIDNLLVVLRHWREDAEKKFSELFDKSKKLTKCNVMSTGCTVVTVSFQYPSRRSL